LLLQRAAFGTAVIVQGSFYLREANPTLAAWCVGLSALTAGGLLLVGLFTPFAGAVVGVGAAGVSLSLLPGCTPNVFDSKPALFFALTMLLTIIGVGPGRFSVDARVFGRREIIIPPPAAQSQPGS
jgi:uncharacterized membrane protein YphA (DoxX/SURF4 family)